MDIEYTVKTQKVVLRDWGINILDLSFFVIRMLIDTYYIHSVISKVGKQWTCENLCYSAKKNKTKIRRTKLHCRNSSCLVVSALGSNVSRKKII